MKSASELRDLLNRIDQRSYTAYKDTKGSYQFEDYVLSIDNVQADPFAPPSKVSVVVAKKKPAFWQSCMISGTNELHSRII